MSQELRDVVITETPRVVVVVPDRRRAIPAGMQAYVTSYWNHYTALPETFTDDGGTTYVWQDIWHVFIDNDLFGIRWRWSIRVARYCAYTRKLSVE